MTSSNVDWKPRLGMEFDNMEAAYQFWLTYSAHVGFGVRKRYVNKSKKDGIISSCRFVCCKEGFQKPDKRDVFVDNHRAETRTDWKARISFVLKNGKPVIHEFVEDHNHPLQLPETTHMLASHRKITEVQAYESDLDDDSGLMQKSTFQLMSTHAGHKANLGYTRLDVKNYLKAKRQRSMVYGEAGCLLQYFQRQLLDNPSFFYAYQMDIEEQIRLSSMLTRCKQIMELRLQARNIDNHNSENQTFVSDDVVQPKGFKQRASLKGRKRLKSWVEQQSKRRRKAPTRGQSQLQAFQDKELTSHQFGGVSCSAPPMYKPPQTQDDQFSFTALLMGPLNDTDTATLDIMSSIPDPHSKN